MDTNKLPVDQVSGKGIRPYQILNYLFHGLLNDPALKNMNKNIKRFQLYLTVLLEYYNLNTS